MQKYLDALVTLARYQGARWRSRGRDAGMIEAFRAKSAGDVFYIVGSGGTVNDLAEADCQKIEQGVSAAINMGGLAPLAFDLYSIEAIPDAHFKDSLADKLRAQAKPGVFWFQDRKKNRNAFVAGLETEFPFHRYTRASVSVRRNLATYRHIFRTVLRPRVFDTPDFNVSFALTGSVARLIFLGCALGYRRICFVGIDLGTTRYFWQEDHQLRDAPPWQDIHGIYDPKPNEASFQGGTRVVPSLFDLLRSLDEDAGVALEFSTIDPRGRSRLTGFLRDDLYGGKGAA